MLFGWSILFASTALAAKFPTVADPMGMKTAYPQQLELKEYESQMGKKLSYSQNPMFDEKVSKGELPPVEKRLPAEPLVLMPYEAVGTYGGTLRGTARAPESGTSEILSWRQVNLVRLSDDLVTIKPDVAKSWKWNEDRSAITFTLRKGHKWSDGHPFTADDIVFFINDIILNKDINPTIGGAWTLAGKPVAIEKIDDHNVTFKFPAPYPGFLFYLTTEGSYFAPYAPKHYYVNYHGAYNKQADADAKADGYNGWVDRFKKIYHKWKDAEVLTKYALTRPTLESHITAAMANTERRVFIANPYYFKVDTSGQQLPYIDRNHERFLNAELQILATINGEIDQKIQGLGISNFPVLKENAEKGGYKVTLPKGGVGTYLSFNITHKDPDLAAIYGDVRFRRAVNHAIDRDEVIEAVYLGLGRPMQTVPLSTSFVTEAHKTFQIGYDPALSNRLLGEMGMKKDKNGFRTKLNGKPYTLLWEYSSQFAGPEFVRLMLDYFKAIGIRVNAKEVTSEASRQNAKAELSDINMEYDVPFEPTLIANIENYVPPYAAIGPMLGVSWKQWRETKGAEGKEPPKWAKRLFEIAEEWKSVIPMSDRYAELGRELVKINQENVTIIGTVGDLPRAGVVVNNLGNVPEFNTVNFMYGYMGPYRADQWFFRSK
jgi:peptide/nickel transport system substrate-binding protein